MIHQLTDKNVKVQTGLAVMVNDIRVDYMRLPNEMGYVFIVLVGPYGPTVNKIYMCYPPHVGRYESLRLIQALANVFEKGEKNARTM